MEMHVLMTHPDGKHSLRLVKGYEIEDSGVAVHRDPLDKGRWRVADIRTGCTFGDNSQTKKQAITDFTEKYSDKLASYRKTPSYKEFVVKHRDALDRLKELEE